MVCTVFKAHFQTIQGIIAECVSSETCDIKNPLGFLLNEACYQSIIKYEIYKIQLMVKHLIIGVLIQVQYIILMNYNNLYFTNLTFVFFNNILLSRTIP